MDGWDPDIVRATGYVPQKDRKGVDVYDYSTTPATYVEYQTSTHGYDFGSAHSTGMQAVYADGAVRSISYGIDATLFNNLGNREDGNVATPP